MDKLIGTKSRWHEIQNTENYILLNVFGSYPGFGLDTKSIKRHMLKAKQLGKKFILNRSTEPNVLWDGPYKTKTVFDFLHDACVEINYPAQNVMLVSCNWYIQQCYEDWRNHFSIANPINVMPSHHWLTRMFNGTMGAEINCYTGLENKQRSRYFTCFNGRARSHKIDVAKYFYLMNFFDTEKAYFSFVFPDQNDEVDKLFKKYPALQEKLPRSIENNTARHLSGDWADVPKSQFMQTMKMKHVQQDSYFDLSVDFIQHEDYSSYNSFLKFKETIPWWKEVSLSEKTTKNFMNRRPFLYLGEAHQLKRLKELGFQTFDHIFNEAYDDVEDYSIRYLAVLSEAENITKQYTLPELHKLIYSKETQDIIEHNYHQLVKVEKELITQEDNGITTFSL